MISGKIIVGRIEYQHGARHAKEMIKDVYENQTHRNTEKGKNHVIGVTETMKENVILLGSMELH